MFSGCLCKEETIFPQLKFAPVIPGEFPEVSRESWKKVKALQEAHICRCGSFYQPRKKERKQEAKPWRRAGNFLFWKRFCLFVILNWGREGGKKSCLLYKPEKLIPHFCSSLSWSVTEGQQHFHVSCWCCFTSSLKSLERRRKNAAEPGFLNHHSGWFLYQKPRPKAVFGSHPWGSGPIVPCTVQTLTESHPCHKGPALQTETAEEE